MAYFSPTIIHEMLFLHGIFSYNHFLSVDKSLAG
jgi:hypothetical protein